MLPIHVQELKRQDLYRTHAILLEQSNLIYLVDYLYCCLRLTWADSLYKDLFHVQGDNYLNSKSFNDISSKLLQDAISSLFSWWLLKKGSNVQISTARFSPQHLRLALYKRSTKAVERRRTISANSEHSSDLSTSIRPILFSLSCI